MYARISYDDLLIFDTDEISMTTLSEIDVEKRIDWFSQLTNTNGEYSHVFHLCSFSSFSRFLYFLFFFEQVILNCCENISDMAEIVKQQIRKFEQIAKPYLYEGPLQSQWSFIEAKTRVKREQITLGLFLSIGILYLAFGWGNDFLSNLIGFLYPAYVS